MNPMMALHCFLINHVMEKFSDFFHLKCHKFDEFLVVCRVFDHGD